MKYLNIVFALLLISSPLIAKDKLRMITMEDFDSAFNGFSYTEGKLLPVSRDDDSFPMKIDFVFDMPQGIGMNNITLDNYFVGSAFIIDLGEIKINGSADISEENYRTHLSPEEIIPGHVYHVMTADASHNGRMKIVSIDNEKKQLSFQWILMD